VCVSDFHLFFCLSF